MFRDPVRRALAALVLCCALLGGAAACGSDDGSGSSASTSPSATSSAQAQKYAKAKFVANASLAAGAIYQWIVKPYRDGRFAKGADGRSFTLVKAGLAGAFAYNRLQAALGNAKGDDLLSKAVAPLTAGIDSLKGLGTKLRNGDADATDIGTFQDVINDVKKAGQDAGVKVTEKVPDLSQLTGG
ncbi:hypothetical protein [Streptomyces albipurpureus]|uniref:Lipoprotein n=1 Tax=Streptomyces albipurpureus TaxID=2897419 RepID=A0ABT0UKI3_9ACTN|nr:hypothetical protein [Streptomyces sp. CWNU-1]MCM2388731.1 hypothetical protein [Streptomyces sp. CWNU-1]